MPSLDDSLTDGQIIETASGTQYQYVAAQNRAKRIPGAGQSRPPSVFSFTPNPVSVGSALSIIGTNYVFSAANTTVDFAKSGGGRTLSTGVTVSSNTSISALVPSDAVDGQVVVTTLDGSGTSSGTLQIQQFSAATIALLSQMAIQGFSPSSAQELAIDNFFVATASLRSAILREYGFLGSTFNSHKIDWNSPGNNHCVARGSVVHDQLGITCGDASAMDPGYNLELSKQNSVAAGLYFTAAPVSSTAHFGAAKFGEGFTMSSQNGANYAFFANNGTGIIINNGALTKGFAFISRTANNAVNAQYASGSNTSTAASSDPTSFYDTSSARLLIGATTNNGSVFNGGGSGSIGHAVIFNRGITVAERTVYGNAVVALQTALGRN